MCKGNQDIKLNIQEPWGKIKNHLTNRALREDGGTEKGLAPAAEWSQALGYKLYGTGSDSKRAAPYPQ